MAAVAGKVGAVYMQTSDASVAFTTEATTDSGDNKTFYITDRDKAYWDKTNGVTVYVDGVETTSGFSVEYAGGYVVFDEAETDPVTVTGKYYTVSQVGGFYNWSLDINVDVADVTTYASDGWKENLPTVHDFAVSAEAYWADDTFLDRLSEEVILALYVDSSASNKYRYEGFAHISSDSVSDPADGIVEDSIEFTGNQELYYREG